MKVTPQEELSWHRERLKKLAKHRKREVEQQEKETQKIRNNYQERKKQVQLQGDIDIENAVANTRKEMAKAMAGKKEKLEKFRTDNLKHQQVLENQRMDLGKYHDERSAEMGLAFEHRYNEIFQDGSEKVKDYEKEINRRFKDIRADQEQEVNIYRADMNAKLMDSAQDFGSRVKDKQDVHKEMLRRNDVQHASNIARQRLEHRDGTTKLLLEQRHETEGRKVIHGKELAQLEDHHKEQISSKQRAFELKTERMNEEHLTVLGLMKERFENRLNALKDAFSKKKTMIESKNQDEFYNVGKINPVIQETPDAYIVSMKVPEHEMENITISPRNRYIKVTYHRRHAANVEELDGSRHTSKRSELMTKTMPVKDIMDPNGVTQKYEDGTLIFKAKKA